MSYLDEFDYADYFYTPPLKPILPSRNPRQPSIAYMRQHFPGVFPTDAIQRYIDPFLGTGPMYFNMACRDKLINDYSLELIAFYEMVRDRDRTFLCCLNQFAEMWDFLEQLADGCAVGAYNSGDDDRLAALLVPHAQTLRSMCFTTQRSEFLLRGLQCSLISRARRFRRAEYEDGQVTDADRGAYMESAFKLGLYEHIRAVYNETRMINSPKVPSWPIKVACWYFMRRYCYQGIFRKNAAGHFTSPYGGVCMNPHLPDIEADYWHNTDLISHLTQTAMESMDFMDFLVEASPEPDDFIFLDPPKLSRTRAFTEFRFTLSDHARLADWLLNECKSQWLMFLDPELYATGVYSSLKKGHALYFDKGCEERTYHLSRRTQLILVKNY